MRWMIISAGVVVLASGGACTKSDDPSSSCCQPRSEPEFELTVPLDAPGIWTIDATPSVAASAAISVLDSSIFGLRVRSFADGPSGYNSGGRIDLTTREVEDLWVRGASDVSFGNGFLYGAEGTAIVRPVMHVSINSHPNRVYEITFALGPARCLIGSADCPVLPASSTARYFGLVGASCSMGGDAQSVTDLDVWAAGNCWSELSFELRSALAQTAVPFPLAGGPGLTGVLE